MSSARVLKVVIIGTGGIGKTTLTKVFCNNEYIDQIMTIGIDIHTKYAMWGGKKIILQIWDISGQNQFKFLLPDFIRRANAAILGYDRTRLSSFQDLDYWLETLRQHEPTIPIFLISTKADREYHPSVSPEMGEQYTLTHNLIGFAETSAKDHYNVDVAFRKLVEHFLRIRGSSPPLIFLGPTGQPDPISASQSAPILNTSNNSEISAPIPSAMDRETSFFTECPHCATPLRETQIKLQMNGTRILCQNCFQYI
jgi:small GTP-binding protein